MARYYTALGPFDSRDAAERARAGMTESDALRACVLRLRDKPQPYPLVSRMMNAAHHEGRTYSHMVQRHGAWLLASNGRHVVGVECNNPNPSATDAKIAALLRDQVPDFAPVYTASTKDLLSHTPLVNVAGVVVPAESLRLCLAVLPEGVRRVGVRRVAGDCYDPQFWKRVRGTYRLALCAPGWRATISPMRTEEKCPECGASRVQEREGLTMARIGVFIPCGSADGANVARATIQDQCAFDDVRIIRLRDRAHVEGVSALEGPRLAVEPSTHVPDGETRDRLRETRDPLREPRPGDWFVDGDDIRLVTVRDDADETLSCVIYYADGTARGSTQPCTSWLTGMRLMTPAEVAAFKADGTRPGKVEAKPQCFGCHRPALPVGRYSAGDSPFPLCETCAEESWPPTRVAATLAARESDPTAHAAPPPRAAEPTPEQIEAYLRGSADWTRHDNRWIYGPRYAYFSVLPDLANLAHMEGCTPAEMRARILGAAKVEAAEPTDDALLDLFERAERAASDTRAARRALYTLGRERGSSDRAALLARAEKAERELADLRATRTGAQERADVVAMLDEQEVYARKRDRQSADAYLHARVRVANGEHIGAAKATTSEPTDAEMAAELREAGWLDCTTGWADTHGDAAGLSLDQAYAAMRAAKGAK